MVSGAKRRAAFFVWCVCRRVVLCEITLLHFNVGAILRRYSCARSVAGITNGEVMALAKSRYRRACARNHHGMLAGVSDVRPCAEPRPPRAAARHRLMAEALPALSPACIIFTAHERIFKGAMTAHRRAAALKL